MVMEDDGVVEVDMTEDVVRDVGARSGMLCLVIKS